LSAFPADCVVVNRRSHRYASFLRLASENAYGVISKELDVTYH